MNDPQRAPTFGEMAMGVNFNPDQRADVAGIKQAYADVCDSLNDARNSTTNNEKKRLLSIAITELQTSQMYAIKAVTWQF